LSLFELIFFIFVTIFTGLTFLVSLYNFLKAPILGKNLITKNSHKFQPLVSILIPARNEEENILDCLKKCSLQDYKNIEILVLDDNSYDNTCAIIEEESLKDRRIKLINGAALPSGWLGKNWACHQLSQEAKGEFYLFIDADVQISIQSVSLALGSVENHNFAMFSIFPTQILNNFGAAIVIPIMNWLLLNFLPLKMIYLSKSPRFVAANGQFIFIKRSVYLEVNGHSGIRNLVVEDMELARSVKKSGNILMTGLGGEVVTCKMYPNFRSSIKGFTKNFYPGFGISSISFLLLITIFLAVYFLPFILIIFNAYWLVNLSFILISKLLISAISRSKPIIEVLGHPIQMLVMFYTGIRSVIFSKLGLIEWKDRVL
jgi:glycosyltransferase involved in cell wall biosynthesis